MSNPLALPLPWNIAAKDYAEVTAPFFANYAEVALDKAKVTAGMRVLDVAAGPGTLALLAARRGCKTTAVDFSPNMIDELKLSASRAGLAVEAHLGDGQALQMTDASFDAVFSMFGLMFFPDRAQGFKEMLRVLVPDGVGVIATWQPMERFPMLAEVFSALRELLPGLPLGGNKAPLVAPSEIIDEMGAAGFKSVAIEEVSATAEAPSLDEAWTFMFRGSPPLALVRRNLGEEAWVNVEQGIVAALQRKYGSGAQKLTMTANLALGRKSGA
jgi:2-polyprenyl-3-methyl-5-hydroxy-6-metoxy-1,4-benzoquinol methylase